MADFSHLEQMEVSTERTARYPLHEITVEGITPTLILKPATEANLPYFNALLKRSRRTGQALRANAINAGMISENRDEDRELYPKYVVVGWEDMIDSKGRRVKFSAGSCKDFLAALPDWLFDNVRNFSGNPVNFVDYDMDVQFDVEGAAKN